jgi:hypothetical protein
VFVSRIDGLRLFFVALRAGLIHWVCDLCFWAGLIHWVWLLFFWAGLIYWVCSFVFLNRIDTLDLFFAFLSAGLIHWVCFLVFQRRIEPLSLFFFASTRIFNESKISIFFECENSSPWYGPISHPPFVLERLWRWDWDGFWCVRWEVTVQQLKQFTFASCLRFPNPTGTQSIMGGKERSNFFLAGLNHYICFLPH